MCLLVTRRRNKYIRNDPFETRRLHESNRMVFEFTGNSLSFMLSMPIYDTFISRHHISLRILFHCQCASRRFDLIDFMLVLSLGSGVSARTRAWHILLDIGSLRHFAFLCLDRTDTHRYPSKACQQKDAGPS
jgi:hypothetical protein